MEDAIKTEPGSLQHATASTKDNRHKVENKRFHVSTRSCFAVW